jgi:hypothetical protein
VKVFQHLDLGLGVHLLDGIGDGFVVERGEHTGAVLRRQLIDDFRQVGRVELGQTGVRDPQLDRRNRALNRVDVFPVDVALVKWAVEPAREAARRTFNAKAAQQSGRANIDCHQAQRALDHVQAEVVDAHDTAAVNVDDLLVHQILLQQDLVAALAELGHVECRRSQPGAAGIERLDRRPRQENLATDGCDDQAGYRRISLTDGHDEVGDGSDRIATLIADGSTY